MQVETPEKKPIDLSTLNPKTLWTHFQTLCTTPRGSKDEAAVAQTIVDLATTHERIVSRDDAHNVVVFIPATKGHEHFPVMCLQSHIDMVLDKDPDIESIFPIELSLDENGILTAKGTTLGADNGIGAAAMMALIADDVNINHGPLELLFTTQEEIGLLGARQFDFTQLFAKLVLNLDSEEEGVLCVGCAGGSRAEAVFDPHLMPGEEGFKYEIKVAGLKGGHSGVDIHRGRANAIKVLANILVTMDREVFFGLNNFTGGVAMNAIPKEAQATVIVADYADDAFEDALKEMIVLAIHKFSNENMSITFEKTPCAAGELVFSSKSQEQFLKAIDAIPNGVVAVEDEDPSMVQTSNNVGLVKQREQSVVVTTMCRSSLKTALNALENTIDEIFTEAGAIVEWGSRYSPWEPQYDSMLVKKVKDCYKKLTGKDAKVETIHAGLECAAISEKMPNVEIVSFGPSMGNVHTTKEWVDTHSVARFWDLLLEVIKVD